MNAIPEYIEAGHTPDEELAEAADVPDLHILSDGVDAARHLFWLEAQQQAKDTRVVDPQLDDGLITRLPNGFDERRRARWNLLLGISDVEPPTPRRAVRSAVEPLPAEQRNDLMKWGRYKRDYRAKQRARWAHTPNSWRLDPLE